jgi:hypothetical protein
VSFREEETSKSLGAVDACTVAAACENYWELGMRLLVNENSGYLSRQMITKLTKLSGSLSQWLNFQSLSRVTKTAASIGQREHSSFGYVGYDSQWVG